MQGYICQHLTIEGNIGAFQTRYKPTIRKPMEAGSRIDTHNPQLPKIPFARSPVSVGKFPSTLDGLARPPKQIATRTTVPLSMLQ
jgi:hypothetical protein